MLVLLLLLYLLLVFRRFAGGGLGGCGVEEDEQRSGVGGAARQVPQTGGKVAKHAVGESAVVGGVEACYQGGDVGYQDYVRGWVVVLWLDR